MRTRTPRTVQDRLSAIDRQIRALSREVAEWDADDLSRLNALQFQIDTTRTRIIYGLRDLGYSDQDIADSLGVSRPAVSKRWPGGGRYVGAAGRYRKPSDPGAEEAGRQSRGDVVASHDVTAREVESWAGEEDQCLT